MSISVKKLTKKYDSPVLEDFSFDFPKKGVVCLLGKSGCGKTTLINCIAGIEKYDSGEVCGVCEKISFVFQEDRLLPWISAKRNVLAVNENESLCDEIFEKMGLSEHKDKLPEELSGGMRQRVSIARAISYGGDVIFLDEPFKGIDVKTKTAVIEAVKELVEGKLCIFITHDISEAKLLSDFIVILDGPPLNVRQTFSAKEVTYEELNDIINKTN